MKCHLLCHSLHGATIAAGILLAGAFASCGGNNSDPSAFEAQARVRVDAQTAGTSITSVTLEASGTNAELVYNTTDATFAGIIVLPLGDHVLVARAYEGVTIVGQGSAPVTIVEGQTVSVFIKVLDTTGPAPTPDASPVITSIVASSSSPRVDASITLTATAVDPNGDPLTFAWEDNCPTSTFRDPTAAVTTWSNTTVGACTLRLTVTSGNLSDTATIGIATLAAGGNSGAAGVDGYYVAHPYIWMALLSSRAFSCYIDRSGIDATCGSTTFPGDTIQLVSHYSLGAPQGDYSADLVSNCGGTISPSSSTRSSAVFSWTAPASPAVCLLTVRVTHEGMTDSFPVAVVTEGCVDDQHDENDGISQATDISFSATPISGLYAHDDDWFRFFYYAESPSQLTIAATSAVGDDLQLELYDASNALVASGTNSASLAAPATGVYYVIHVGRGAGATTCNSPYSLSLVP